MGIGSLIGPVPHVHLPSCSKVRQDTAGRERKGNTTGTGEFGGEGNTVFSSLMTDPGMGQEPARWSVPAQPGLWSLWSSHFHGVLSVGLQLPPSSREEPSQGLHLHQFCNRALFTCVLYLDYLGSVH